jgi:oligoribonuclease NrnB/cAMP/cGMP phosphodiesterase (DHH superfamily)
MVRSGIEHAIAHPSDLVHIVSHGPHCLDGVTAAVAVARFHAGADVRARFANNPEINDVLRDVPPPAAGQTQDLWITDIGWTEPATDRHLRELAAAGTRIFWIDHHRTAIERVRRGAIDVPFATQVVEDTYAASRLVFEHLGERLRREGHSAPGFFELERLVLLADDNDRWIHALPGSRELALTVAAMHDRDAFRELLTIDAAVTYTPAMREAEARVAAELAATHELAERTRSERRVGDITVVAAWCEGYPSEIGDAWGRRTPNAVFALYDTKSGGVSFRRSPNCRLDLSRLAERFGGGGHPAAAGCQIPGIGERDAAALATAVADRVAEMSAN